MAGTSPRRAWQLPDPAFWQGKRVLLMLDTAEAFV